MDPLIGSTVLSVGGSLLGGLFGDRSAKKAVAQQRAWALEDQSMQWVRHREASERGGFNPLATLGMGQGVALLRCPATTTWARQSPRAL